MKVVVLLFFHWKSIIFCSALLSSSTKEKTHACKYHYNELQELENRRGTTVFLTYYCHLSRHISCKSTSIVICNITWLLYHDWQSNYDLFSTTANGFFHSFFTISTNFRRQSRWDLGATYALMVWAGIHHVIYSYIMIKFSHFYFSNMKKTN